MKHADAIIIGSGQGGTPLAKKLAASGYKTTLIERRFVGGTCVNDGCTPTKAMVASAEVAQTIRESVEFGINAATPTVDLNSVVDRQKKIVQSFRDGSEKSLLETKNLSLIYGEASFSAPKKIVVAKREGGSEELTSDLIIIDTGTRPKIPDIAGLVDVPFLTSTSILDLKELPKHLLILGSGYIGLEFGQMFKRFGSEVTLLEHADRILKKEDEDISREVYEILRTEGIDIKLQAKAVQISQALEGIDARISCGQNEEWISCSHVLVATGRTPNTEALNLGAAGIKTNDKGFIAVNERLETSTPGVYAIGDVNGGPAFTHISYNDHLIIYNNIIRDQHQTTTSRLVPYCMYIDPQLARVGITEQEAKARGIKYKVASMPMAHVARAIETSQTKGTLKVIVDPDHKTILGVTILGAEGGELMSVLQLAMIGGVTHETIRDTIFAHPTYAESLNNLFSSI